MTAIPHPTASASARRARFAARVAAARDGRTVAAGSKAWRAVSGDFPRWWLHTTNPPALGVWIAARQPRRTPRDDVRLTWAWRVDHWTTGMPLAAISILLFLAAAGMRWIACHPARRWAFLILSVATAALWLA